MTANVKQKAAQTKKCGCYGKGIIGANFLPGAIDHPAPGYLLLA
jgi:hypothetical protein